MCCGINILNLVASKKCGKKVSLGYLSTRVNKATWAQEPHQNYALLSNFYLLIVLYVFDSICHFKICQTETALIAKKQFLDCVVAARLENKWPIISTPSWNWSTNFMKAKAWFNGNLYTNTTNTLTLCFGYVDTTSGHIETFVWSLFSIIKLVLVTHLLNEYAY